MYRQILLDPRDRDFQRILWSPSPTDPASDFRLNTVTYGTTCAPFLALRVIKQLVQDEGQSFPLAVPVLENHIYVDNLLFGANDLYSLKEVRNQTCALLSRGGFILRKWASNQPDLLLDIPVENHGLVLDKSLNGNEQLNLLGIHWNPSSDKFQFSVSTPTHSSMTKRSVLSIIARIFDPMGWAAPIIVLAKIFMQQLWKHDLGWDDELSEELRTKWNHIQRRLCSLSGTRLVRWIQVSTDTHHCELHGFADASSQAYAAVVYIRVTSLTGEISTSLLTGKSKVAPIKTLSIPRLELSALVLLARTMKAVISSLSLSFTSIHCWSNSSVALAWVSQDPAGWKTFVSNRVSTIQTDLPQAEWHHVSSGENPADCASRGLLTQSLESFEMWWLGPAWLRLSEEKWPSLPVDFRAITPPEKRVVNHASPCPIRWDFAHKSSSWTRLIRVTAYVQRFITKCRRILSDLTDNNSIPVSVSTKEYNRAETYWLRVIQSEVFRSELSALKLGHPVSQSSALLSLNPFLDHDQLIRVGGRIAFAPLSFDKRHQIVLASHPLVDLIIRYHHVRNLHSGPQLTMSSIRERYWILRARNLVKTIIHQCIPCVRERAIVPTQLMGSLPRISASTRAFTHCDIDYAGPVFVKISQGRGFRSRKAYLAVFVCMTSKAVHLELVSSYSTPSFIDAFTRFCSRRGLLSDVYSDNGTNFVGADKELKKTYREAIQNPDFHNQTAIENIQWHFMPPSAPHFGGLWEAGVRSIKTHLKRTIGNHSLTFEEYSTLLCRVEACLNSRPIGQLTSSPDDFEPLTPGHFLIGTALTAHSESSTLHLNENRLSRWQMLRSLSERFWKLWQHDYVNTLQQRTKWRQVQRAIRPGMLVLLRNNCLPPSTWEMGRLIECYPGSDGLIRVVKVKTVRSSYKRPISQICVLPIELNSSSDSLATPEANITHTAKQ